MFLPQLLLYPNPTDPLNGEAAALLLKQEERYKEKVAGLFRRRMTFILYVSHKHHKDYVRRFATPEAAAAANNANGDDTDELSADEMSPYASDEDEDDKNDDPMQDFDDL